MPEFDPDKYLNKKEEVVSKDVVGFDPDEFLKKKEEPDFGASLDVSGKSSLVPPEEQDPTFPSGGIILDPSNIKKTSEDKRIYEEYSVFDDSGQVILDINTLTDRYKKVVNSNIPKGADIRMPTKEEYDSLTGKNIPIDEFVINSNKQLSPSSSFEYILGKGASQSLLVKSLAFLIDAGTSYSSTPYSDAYVKSQVRSRELAEYYNNYDSNAIEDAAGFAIGMFLDTPIFGGSAQVGKYGYKSALTGYSTIQNRMLMKGVEKSVAERAMAASTERLLAKSSIKYGMAAIGGGTALGAYSFLGDVAYQVESGKAVEDLDWSNSLKEGGKSFLIGSTLGLMSQGFGQLSYKTTGQIKNTFNRRMVQAGFGTTEFAAENIIFLYGSAALDKDVSFSDITWEDASKLALELGALKLSGAMRANVEGLNKSKNFNKSKINKEEFNIEFDNIEKQYLGKKGIASDIIVKELRKDQKAYEKILDDPNIPILTKYKLLWSTKGIQPDFVSLPVRAETVKTDEGFIIETFDSKGNKIEARQVKNERTALTLLSQLDPQFKENEMRDKAAELTIESKAIIDNEIKAEGLDESVYFAAINKSPTERTPEDIGAMDIFYEKINKYSKKQEEAKIAEKKITEEKKLTEEKEIAKKTLEEEKKPEYLIEGKKIENKKLFLEEVSKYVGKEESPKFEVKNDEKAIRDVEDILTKKKGIEDALQEDKIIKEEGLQKKEPKKEEVLIEPEKIVKAQVEAHAEKGGSTITDEGKNLSETDNFAVSIYPKSKVEIDGKVITDKQLADFREKNKDLLSKKDHILGTWYDSETGKSVLDISVVKTDLNEALAIGRKYEQKEVFDLSKGVGVKYGEIADKIETKPIGSKSTAVARTFEESKKSIKKGEKGVTKNSWVRQSTDKDNKDRTLLVQFSSDFMKGKYKSDPISKKYYDKLYETRKGYNRSDEFWEVPHWIANAAKAVPKSDVYVIRDLVEANKFFKESGYKTVAFSTLDVNKGFIKDFAKSNPNVKFSVGGYVDFSKEFKGQKNIKIFNNMKEFTKSVGERTVDGYDYRHFKGSKFIPRLRMSEGCKHKCAFCCIDDKVKSLSKEEVDSQVKGLKDIDAELVYLDDKTFGQADNYKYLEDVYKKVKKDNPKFEGFIIQTTASQMKKLSPEFIKKSGIKYIELGVETFNDELLKKNKKPATEKSIEEAAEKIKESGAVFIPNIIVGLPGETKATYKKTLDFLKKYSDNISHVNAYNLALYEGTELADNMDVKIDADLNENVVKKSFHTNPELHKQFSKDLYKFGMELLDKNPVNLKEVSKSVGKTMAQKDDFINELKLVVDVDPPKVGTEKDFRKYFKSKVENVNEILNKSENQGLITPFENKVIRGRIEKAVGGTAYQMKQAVEYADRIVKDTDFRVKEQQKFKDISQIKKEVRGLFDKKDKYKRIKDIFNVKEAAEVVDEYSKLTESDLINMNHDEISAILSEIKETKIGLRGKAKEKIEAREQQQKQWVERASEVIKPIKKLKPAEAKYVEKDIKSKEVKIKYNPWKTFDTNLTSAFSRFAAKSTEPGKVGKDWLNRELYYGKLVPAERNYKKYLKETGDKLINYIKKEYSKDARDVMNDMSEERVEITVDVKEGDKVSKETRQISKEEAIKWYMLIQDPTLRSRIFEPMTLSEKATVYKGNGFTDETVSQIEKALTPKDKKLADYLFVQYQDARGRYNEFMKDKFGVNLPDNPKYSNIYSEYFENYEGLNVEDMMKGSPVGTLKSNNIISRVANKNTIKDVGALSSYFDYLDKMEWMYQFSEPLEMYRGIFKNKQIRRLIEVSHGKESLKLLDDYEKIIVRDLANINEKSIDRITKNFANAALGLNPNITVKQLFSTTAAMTEVNPAQFLNEIKNLSIDAIKATTDKSSVLRELASRDAIAMRGDVGLGMDVFLNPYVRKNKLSSKKILNAVVKLADKATKSYGKTIEFGDKGGALIGGYIVYKTKYKDYIKKGLDIKEAKSRALIDFDRFIDATQQSMSMFNTSMTRFKAGSLGRAVTPFTSAPAQLTRLEMNMWRNIATGVTQKGQFQNKEVLKNLGRIAVVRQLIPALYQFAADGWEWDSDNQSATAILGNLQGVMLIGKLIEKFKNEMMDSEYDVPTLPIIDNIQKLITNTFDLVDMQRYPYLYDEKEKKAIIKREADQLGLLIGQPVRSIRNIVTGDIGNFFDGVKSDREEIAKEAVDNNVPLESVLIDKYGAEFLYNEDGNLRTSTRGYIEEYVYQVNKDKYGKFSDEIKKVMDMRRNDDIKKYLIRRGKRMNDADFRLMLQYMSEDNDFGGNKTIRFISTDVAEDVQNIVIKAKR